MSRVIFFVSLTWLLALARTWYKRGAVDLGAELGVNYYGAELWKLINFNLYRDLDIEKYG